MIVDDNLPEDLDRTDHDEVRFFAAHSEAEPMAEDDSVVVAEIVPPPRPVWPSVVVVISAIWVGIMTSALALAAVALARDEMDLLVDSETRMQWISDLTASRFGLLVLLLPSQLAFALVAAGAALFSRDPWRERLGLRAGRLPVWTWLLFLAGTPMINIVSSQFISLLADEPSEQLQMLEQLFQFRSFSTLLTLLLLVGCVPGVVEELLFRGYLQRRLLTRLHPIVAIGVCSVFFAAAHMDPMHAVGVLPLGIWLGVIAWRADSIWPAVCGHVGNNSFSIVMAGVMGTEADVEQIGLVAVFVLGITLLSFVGAITMLALLGGRQVTARDEVDGV